MQNENEFASIEEDEVSMEDIEDHLLSLPQDRWG